jgi:hypothetical protein
MSIRISSYMNNNSGNYGLNSVLIELGVLDLYFSYRTIVAFRTPDDGLVVSENLWKQTTGKHLNQIGEGVIREPRALFEAKLNAVLKQYNLITPEINV